MGWLTDILKDIPTVGVARERIALAEQKYELLERENETLKLENVRLKGELEALRRQVPSTEWVEARGVLFKRRPDGRFEQDAYCPSCKLVLSTFREEVFPPQCSQCKMRAPFFKSEIPEIIASLQAG